MKKKLLTLIIAVISALCCAFAFTACDDKDGNDGELVVPGNSFVCTEVVIEYTEEFYSLSESEKESWKSTVEESKAECERRYLNMIWKFNKNGTSEFSNAKDRWSGEVITEVTMYYYKLEKDRISFMYVYDNSKDISEVEFDEQIYGIVKDGKIELNFYDGNNQYYYINYVCEKV